MTDRIRIRRTLQATTFAAITLAALVPGVGNVASAATTVVDCGTASDDIAAVQSAINGASDGGTVALRGECDFKAAPNHGGSTTSIDATAVLVRPGVPVKNLTITAADGPQSATVVGDGTETAFAIAPGNDGVTIRGLRFESFARPIVIIGADDVTIGSTGGIGTGEANRIVGRLTMNSSILAVGTGSPMTVSYGASGATTGAVLPADDIKNLRVVGNYLSFHPPAVGAPSPGTDMIGVDVRQTGNGRVDGVTINANAVAMITTEFASFTQNAVRVQGTAAVPASNPPALSDYRITDVEIRNNNLGRFEDIEGSFDPEFDPRDVHAAGRTGILAIRVGDFEIKGNRVRSRLSASATPTPGGGIVTSDSSFGEIRENDILVVADPNTTSSDVGAIGVVAGIPSLMGDTATDQAAHDVLVAFNVIGGFNNAIGSQRGMVFNGSDLVTAVSNNVVSSRDKALSVSARVGSAAGRLPVNTKRGLFCSNSLDGTTDNPAEVHLESGVNPPVANSVPGGKGLAGNFDCKPTNRLPSRFVVDGGQLKVDGTTWASRQIEISVYDEQIAKVAKTVTAGADGLYSVVFSSSELAVLTDGTLWIEAIAQDPAGLTMKADAVSAFKDFSRSTGLVFMDDGGDGYANGVEITVGLPVEWLAPPGDWTHADIWFEDSIGNMPTTCGKYRTGIEGAGQLNIDCAEELADGPFSVHAQWVNINTHSSSAPVRYDSNKDTTAAAVQIDSPADTAVVKTSLVELSGVAEPNSRITVWPGHPGPILGQVDADGNGDWTLSLALGDGNYTAAAYQEDVAGNRGPSGTLIEFSVDTRVFDTTPPPIPVIQTPLDGEGPFPNTVVVTGGGTEPGAVVKIYSDIYLLGGGIADQAGNWAAELRFTKPSGTVAVPLYATATDSSENVSDASGVVTIIVDTTPPTPVIETPEQDDIILPASGNTVAAVTVSGRVTDDTGVKRIFVQYFRRDPVSGSYVEVLASQLATCSACPGENVTFSHTPATPLPFGQYQVYVYAEDVSGNLSTASVTFTKVP